jgi:hypothetical protein
LGASESDGNVFLSGVKGNKVIMRCDLGEPSEQYSMCLKMKLGWSFSKICYVFSGMILEEIGKILSCFLRTFFLVAVVTQLVVSKDTHFYQFYK